MPKLWEPSKEARRRADAWVGLHQTTVAEDSDLHPALSKLKVSVMDGGNMRAPLNIRSAHGNPMRAAELSGTTHIDGHRAHAVCKTKGDSHTDRSNPGGTVATEPRDDWCPCPRCRILENV